MYVNQLHMNKANSETIMLEIKLPREIDKSPLAMEIVLANLTQSGGVSSWEARGIKGALPATFSLEIASLEGVVHFYIRTHKKFKELLSSSFYAHYPGVEVIETVDYTTFLPRYEHHKKTAAVWANGYKLGETFIANKGTEKPEKLGFFAKWLFLDTPDPEKAVKEGEVKLPGDSVPIRTYIDLGLDKQKEEMKVDPLISILEFFGSLGKGEFAALQFIIQDESVHDKKSYKIYHSKETHKEYTLRSLAKEHKENLRGKVTIKKGTPVIDEYGYKIPMKTEEGKEQEYKKYQEDVTKMSKEIELTFETKNKLELIERKISKPLLACVCRCMYVVKPDAKFNPNYIQNVISLFKPFLAPGFNNLAPTAFSDGYDFDWLNPNKVRSNWRAEEMFDAFVEREGFHPHTGLLESFSSNAKGATWDSRFNRFPGYIRRTVTMVLEATVFPFGHPHADEVFVLNTEELATLFHFPGLVASVPTLPRIDSRKAVAPVNLPV